MPKASLADNSPKNEIGVVRGQPGCLVEPLDMEAAFSPSRRYPPELLASVGEPKAP